MTEKAKNWFIFLLFCLLVILSVILFWLIRKATLPLPIKVVSTGGENKVKPPQNVAPIVYIMHDSSYEKKEGSGALGGWFWVGWKDIEPAKDQYNWDRIDARLNQGAAKETTLRNGQVIKKPLAISIILQANVRENGVPDYIYKQITNSADINVWKNQFSAVPKLNGQVCTTETCQGCTCNCSPDLRPPWENQFFQERFKALVTAFGQKYNNDLRVNSIWITSGLYGENVTTGTGNCLKGPTCSYQNECRFDYGAGGAFGNWLIQKKVLQTYREAFPTKPLFIIETAPTGRKELVDQALSLASQSSPVIGIKHNGLEYDLPGQTADNDQWKVLNYYWQEVDKRNLEGMVGFEHFFAAGPSQTYWALLAGLSRRMTLIDLPKDHLNVLASMQKEAETAGQSNTGDYFPMWSFLEDHLGRKATNTPSVWIVLRETQYADGEPGDWEFFLYRPENIPGQSLQRQSGQDKTVAVKTSDLPEPAKNSLIGRSGTAFVRRTDQANQSFFMYFHIDDKWPALQTAGFFIEVTYLDKGNDSFALEYGSDANQKILVQKTNTNKFIRKNFNLEGISLNQKINTASDNFRINCREDGDEIIHMIRVIPKNWQAPKWDFSGQNYTPYPTRPVTPTVTVSKTPTPTTGILEPTPTISFSPTPTPTCNLIGDLNCDGKVNEADFSVIFQNWSEE